MRIAIIPARGGSKRIKSKNVCDFFGKPMVAFVLSAAQQSGLFDKIHVSTESEEIKTIVEDLGFPIDFMRAKELADDYTGLVPVIEWVIAQYDKIGEQYDDICCILPASPLLKSDDLVKAFLNYDKHNKLLPLMTVAEYPVAVEWAFSMDEESVVVSKTPEFITMRSQDLAKAYYDSGTFYIFHRSHLRGNETFTKGKFLSHLIPKCRAVDIDTEEDLHLARVLYKGQE